MMNEVREIYSNRNRNDHIISDCEAAADNSPAVVRDGILAETT